MDDATHLNHKWTKLSRDGQKPGGAERDSIVDMK